ncbi:catechol 2,3-dioxygenase-like lactoylglutathione lyase family enzyme [Nocardioides thalensis]|uniref:Catechol 2,3-dioxygenase-like lactoylglutathione lyase family enzyme n=1 Tax=Nocardioides thalensis TaxID=1914755 RepID=A0A853C196_9ACTN|nr:VOC family protein [Nocardioides thalensis]NYJ01990.1 catechol 2,3-dioxygenase-like lactoylglutathione lyase family enzyme [Nocardioides thalensis]
MALPYINHVALPVDDVDRVSAFYVDWFGARVIPSPRFPVPVAWLMLGKIQIHLVQHDAAADRQGQGPWSSAYHFAIAIDDLPGFVQLYDRAHHEGVVDTETFPHHTYELPRGEVQFWLRDPAGNVIEVDYADATALPPHISQQVRTWAGDHELSDWNRAASLFRPEQAGIALSGDLGGGYAEGDHSADSQAVSA